MSATGKSSHQRDESDFLSRDFEQPYMLTPFIITFCAGILTDIDIQNFLEAGVRIVRLRMTHVMCDKMVIHEMLKSAVELCCKKYYVSNWPVAITIDLPNALVRTGFVSEKLHPREIVFKKGNFVQLTCDTKYWKECDTKRIFIDDPLIMKVIKPQQEISIPLAYLYLVCTKIINDQTIMCEIISNGRLTSSQVVCFRGLKLLKPPLSDQDMELLKLVKDNEFDAVIINSIRQARTACIVRNFFTGHHKPLIFGCVSEQEGLDNIDNIIEATDGIMLAREFISESILNRNKMTCIQLNICAKCKRAGKPIFISGNIFEKTATSGDLSYNEVHDATNIVLQGAGLVLRNTYNPNNVLRILHLLNSICRNVEPMSNESYYYWRLSTELEPPVNAADGVVVACAIAARQMNVGVIIVLTKTGRTAQQLSRIHPKSVIVAVTTHAPVARQLQLFRGIIPLVYDKREKEDWHLDTSNRIRFAVQHCVHYEIMKYNQPYAILRKSSQSSAYCDYFSTDKVTIENSKK